MLVLPFRVAQGGDAEFAILVVPTMDIGKGSPAVARRTETIVEAARREAFEEARIPREVEFYKLKMRDFVPVNCFEAAVEWPPDTYVVPRYFFACDVAAVELAVSREHTETAWMPYEAAYDRLRYESNKTGLWELSERLCTTAPAPPTRRDAPSGVCPNRSGLSRLPT